MNMSQATIVGLPQPPKNTPERSELIDRIYLDVKLRPVADGSFKHLIGIDGRNNGFFLANNSRMIVDCDTFREIVAEAKEAGVNPRWFIYGRLCTYCGPNMEFMQIGAAP